MDVQSGLCGCVHGRTGRSVWVCPWTYRQVCVGVSMGRWRQAALLAYGHVHLGTSPCFGTGLTHFIWTHLHLGKGFTSWTRLHLGKGFTSWTCLHLGKGFTSWTHLHLGKGFTSWTRLHLGKGFTSWTRLHLGKGFTSWTRLHLGKGFTSWTHLHLGKGFTSWTRLHLGKGFTSWTRLHLGKGSPHPLHDERSRGSKGHTLFIHSLHMPSQTVLRVPHVPCHASPCAMPCLLMCHATPPHVPCHATPLHVPCHAQYVLLIMNWAGKSVHMDRQVCVGVSMDVQAGLCGCPHGRTGRSVWVSPWTYRQVCVGVPMDVHVGLCGCVHGCIGRSMWMCQCAGRPLPLTVTYSTSLVMHIISPARQGQSSCSYT